MITSAGPVVSEADIQRVVSSWTGIPVEKVSADESDRLRSMEETLHRRVIGQDDAVTAVCRAIRRARAGLGSPRRPIGSFVFAGPTGVGKTELVKALASCYYGSEDAMVRLDMSEYSESFAAARLVGASPGYVGYQEGGQLTEAVRRRPHTVVLLDEIEKAHGDVHNVLLQVMEDGRLTDGKGRTVDFRNALIVMTSNAGSGLFVGNGEGGEVVTSVMVEEEMKRKHGFPPEFLNRLDEVIVFRQLGKPDVKKIASIMLGEVVSRVRERGIRLQVTEGFKELVVEKGYDPSYGARPLRRAIVRLVEDKLADMMLAGDANEGDSLVVDTDSAGKVVVHRQHDEPRPHLQTPEPIAA
jgi:ATP-dependent Clp protease ATP-binding subunit ClpC